MLRARTSFTVWDERGIPTTYPAGTLVPDSDPVVKGREHLFAGVEPDRASPITQGVPVAVTMHGDGAPGTPAAKRRNQKA